MRRTIVLPLLLLVACKEKTPTQIVLSVVTDLPVPAELDSVSIKVEHRGNPVNVTHSLDPAAQKSIRLPATLVLLPGPDRSQPVLITAAGSLGGTQVVERSARLRFVEGRALLVRLALLRGCSGKTCEDGKSCGEQGCASIELDSSKLPDYTPEEALRGLDASSGPSDRSKGDGPRPDAPPDGPRPDVPAADRSLDQGKPGDRQKQDSPITPDTSKLDTKPDSSKPDSSKPDVCVPSCGAVCGANNGCGGKCYSDDKVDACNQDGQQAGYWRCVLSAGLQLISYGTQISQVCQYTSASGGWFWRTYNQKPSNCDACCGSLSGSPPPACKQ